MSEDYERSEKKLGSYERGKEYIGREVNSLHNC